jgi:hypothetical protein
MPKKRRGGGGGDAAAEEPAEPAAPAKGSAGGATAGSAGGEEENLKVHCKKRFATFPSPAGMSLIKLSVDGNNLIIPAKGKCGQLHPGWGRENGKPFFYSDTVSREKQKRNNSTCNNTAPRS